MAQMTAICMAACESSEYQTKLKSQGFSRESTITMSDGTIVTHDEIAAAFHAIYVNRRPEFAVAEGSKPRIKRKSERQFRRACAIDVGAEYHISWMTVIMALLVLLLTGPMGLVIAIVICLFEWYFTKDVLEDKTFLMAMGAA